MMRGSLRPGEAAPICAPSAPQLCYNPRSADGEGRARPAPQDDLGRKIASRITTL
jgi:hypothetical protein